MRRYLEPPHGFVSSGTPPGGQPSGGHQPGKGRPSGPPPIGGSSGRHPPPQVQRLVIEFSPAVERALERIADALEGLNLSGVIMSQEMDELLAQVERNTSVIGSAAGAFAGIKAQLDKAMADLTSSGADTAKLAALSAQLAANSDRLAAATVANTPAASVSAPAPVATKEVMGSAPAAPADTGGEGAEAA